MGRNSQQRKAIKKQRRDRRNRARNRGPGPGPADPGGWDDAPSFERERSHHHDPPPGWIPDMREALLAAADAQGTAAGDGLLRAMAQADRDGSIGRAATQEVTSLVDMLYEHGWQPADIMHVARKKLPAAGEYLLGAVIDVQARRARADERAPDEWVTQLNGIRESLSPAPSGDSAVKWLVRGGQDVVGAWAAIAASAGVLATLPVLEQLSPPPSRWPAQRTSRPTPATTHAATYAAAQHDPKVLARIRALLAKAEATEFPDEAEALTGKAQALMSRYVIDEAVLQSDTNGSGVRARRVHVDSPYAATKVRLLAAVGAANRVRVIWLNSVDMATMVGFPLELDLVEMLYTSLLVQATRAMTDAGRNGPGARSISFRRAFLLAYAQRIGERLAQADSETTAQAVGAEVVLARRSQEVDDEFDKMFPNQTKMRSRRVNAHGWHAGREAADRATIAKAQIHADA